MSVILKGIRGATSVSENSKEAILIRTEELLRDMVEKNSLQTDRIASVFFTTTLDLNAEFPAVAARKLGWTDVPLICAREIDVPGSLPLCIRVLIHYNILDDKPLKHVYLHEAKKLRKDLAD